MTLNLYILCGVVDSVDESQIRLYLLVDEVPHYKTLRVKETRNGFHTKPGCS